MKNRDERKNESSIPRYSIVPRYLPPLLRNKRDVPQYVKVYLPGEGGGEGSYSG